jgi:hypothetical protein
MTRVIRMFVVAPLVVLVLVFFTFVLLLLLFSVNVGGAMTAVVLDRVGRTVPPPPVVVVLTGTDNTGVGSIVGDGEDGIVVGLSDWTIRDGGRLLLVDGSVVTVIGIGD